MPTALRHDAISCTYFDSFIEYRFDFATRRFSTTLEMIFILSVTASWRFDFAK